MAGLNKVKNMLNNSEHTFVCVRTTPEGGEKIYESDKKGIAPIMEKIEQREDYFSDAVVADRVIGKAAAMLLVASGVRSIYAEIMSDHAKKFLEYIAYEKSVGRMRVKLYEFEAGKVVPYIINRDKTGMCPMEKAVLELDNHKLAFGVLKEALEKLKQG